MSSHVAQKNRDNRRRRSGKCTQCARPSKNYRCEYCRAKMRGESFVPDPKPRWFTRYVTGRALTLIEQIEAGKI